MINQILKTCCFIGHYIIIIFFYSLLYSIIYYILPNLTQLLITNLNVTANPVQSACFVTFIL